MTAGPPDPRLILPTEILRPTWGARLRRYFLTGLVIAAPLAITASVTMQQYYLVAPGRENAFQSFVQSFMSHYNLSYKAIPARSTTVPGTIFTVAVVGQSQTQIQQIFAGLAQQWAVQP